MKLTKFGPRIHIFGKIPTKYFDHADCEYSDALLKKLMILNQEFEGDVNIHVIQEVLGYARFYHDGQYRRSGEPYIVHPIKVAEMCSDYILDTDIIAAALLHDVVEDTEAPISDIQEFFGDYVAELVDKLTRIKKPEGLHEKLSCKDILYNAKKSKCWDAIFIKYLDRLHNLQTIGHLPLDKQIKIASETREHFTYIPTVVTKSKLKTQNTYEYLQILRNNTIVSEVRSLAEAVLQRAKEKHNCVKSKESAESPNN